MKSKVNCSGKAGFTLIELIVVIAILAILGSVGTVGYSAYVDRANKAADVTMFRDIAHALSLGAYSKNYTTGGAEIGVGVSKDKPAVASNPDVTDMMVSAFGTDWENALKLQYDWSGTESGSLSGAIAGENADYFDSVPNSSFYGTDGATEDLAAKVDEIASAFKGILGDENGYKFANFWGSGFGNKVKDEGLNIKDSQTAANLTVMAAANAIANSTGSHADWIASWQDDSKEPEVNATDNGYVAPLVMNYAKYVSLVSYVNNPDNNVDRRDVKQVNNSYSALVTAMNNLGNKSEDTSYIQAFNDAMNTFEASAITGKDYYKAWQTAPEGGKSQAQIDAEAFIATMAAVNSLEDTYVNKDKSDMLNKGNAFTEFGAADVLDQMVSYSGLSALHGSDVFVTLKVNADGTVEINYPEE